MDTVMIIVPSLEGGGQEKVSTITGSVLCDYYKIVFLVFTDKNAKYEVPKKVKFINIDIPIYNNIILKIWSVFIKLWKVRRIKKEYNISKTISFGRPANIINCLSKIHDDVICSIRNSSFLETQKHNIINTLIYHRSDKIVFISEGQKDLTEKYFPVVKNKSYVIHNPCDVEFISKMSSVHANIPWKNGHILVTCGRLEPVKCFINLCNAFALAKEVVQDIKLLIIGEGRLRQVIEKHIRDIGLEEDIKILGFVSNPYKYMSKCSVFVFSSSREGFANVIIEALACGLPVISTAYPFGSREILAGNSEYVTQNEYTIEEYGLLTPVFTEEDIKQDKEESVFASAIVRILTDEEIYKKLQNLAKSRSTFFGIDKYKDKWLHVMQS